LQLVFLYKLVNGVAESSFGTHVAKLAGVPMDVVERADVISQDFAQKFKEKLQLNQEKNVTTKMPLVAQADFAYLYKLVTGQLGEQSVQDPEHTAEVLRRMKKVARRYVEIQKKA
jgi:DNA mismatch repair protein MSH6